MGDGGEGIEDILREHMRGIVGEWAIPLQSCQRLPHRFTASLFLSTMRVVIFLSARAEA